MVTMFSSLCSRSFAKLVFRSETRCLFSMARNEQKELKKSFSCAFHSMCERYVRAFGENAERLTPPVSFMALLSFLLNKSSPFFGLTHSNPCADDSLNASCAMISFFATCNQFSARSTGEGSNENDKKVSELEVYAELRLRRKFFLTLIINHLKSVYREGKSLSSR